MWTQGLGPAPQVPQATVPSSPLHHLPCASLPRSPSKPAPGRPWPRWYPCHLTNRILTLPARTKLPAPLSKPLARPEQTSSSHRVLFTLTSPPRLPLRGRSVRMNPVGRPSPSSQGAFLVPLPPHPRPLCFRLQGQMLPCVLS